MFGLIACTSKQNCSCVFLFESESYKEYLTDIIFEKTVYNFEWENGIYGLIHDVFFENVNAFVEDTKIIKPIIHICSHDENCKFYNIKIDGLFINEKETNMDDFEVISKNVRQESL